MSSCPNYPTQLPTISRPLELMEKKCIGVDMTINELKQYWTNNDCPSYFYTKIHKTTQGLSEVQEDFNYLFAKYFSNHTLSVPGSVGYDSFQQTLIDTCSNNVQYQLYGACQPAAKNMCKNCSSQQVTNNKDLLKLCGCQVKSLNKDINIPAECDPLCAHEQVVKNVNSHGEPELCHSTVCVINNISINTANSISGGSSFTQVCPQCEMGGCRCIIDATIATNPATAGINNNLQFTQYCGNPNEGNSVCIVIDEHGNSKTVDCQNVIKPLEPTTYPIDIPIWFYVLLVLIIIILIIAIFTNENIYKNNNTHTLTPK